jgi:hypothetical protein
MKGERKMDEYVKRAAIMEFPIRKDHCDKERANEHFIFGIESVLEYVENLPSADVAPVVHGRWTAQCVVEMDGGWTLEDMPYNEYQHSNPICSICRKTALLDGGEDYVASPYCPNCGAKMDGGVE